MGAWDFSDNRKFIPPQEDGAPIRFWRTVWRQNASGTGAENDGGETGRQRSGDDGENLDGQKEEDNIRALIKAEPINVAGGIAVAAYRNGLQTVLEPYPTEDEEDERESRINGMRKALAYKKHYIGSLL